MQLQVVEMKSIEKELSVPAWDQVSDALEGYDGEETQMCAYWLLAMKGYEELRSDKLPTIG